MAPAAKPSVNNDGGNSVPTVANGNMLGVDPKFVQAATDFHLQGSSPALDAGPSGYGLATSGQSTSAPEGYPGPHPLPPAAAPPPPAAALHPLPLAAGPHPLATATAVSAMAPTPGTMPEPPSMMP